MSSFLDPLPVSVVNILANTLALANGVLVLVLLLFLGRRLLLPRIEKICARLKWGGFFYRSGVFHNLLHWGALLIALSPIELTNAKLQMTLVYGSLVYMLVLLLELVRKLLHASEQIYNQFSISREKPVKLYFQLAMLLLYVCAFLLLVALASHRSLLAVMSGLGALTAVLLLIFKDPISGFASGIQLLANHMVRIGDWVEVPSHGIEGEITEINLTTLKLRNRDHTISTVPVLALTSGTLRNWRGMEEIGGRCIRRSLLFDIQSIHFVAEDEGETNLGRFCAYAQNYLVNHPAVREEHDIVIRQMQANGLGLPLEIFAFTNQTQLVDFEKVQNAVFEHLIAKVPDFDLQLYQRK